MRSVCARSLTMSIWSRRQWLTISSAASFGMSPSRPCTLARADSMSRYFCVRFSSDHTWRMSSVLKMPWKIAESMIVDAMVCLSRMDGKESAGAALERALRLQHDRAVDHSTVEPGGPRRRRFGGEHAPRPFDCWRAGCQCRMDRCHLPGMDAQLGRQAVATCPREVG